MLLVKSQIVLLVAVIGLVYCGQKWPNPSRSSEESISRSLSSEEYQGGVLPPLRLGGASLPNPVYATANGTVVVSSYVPRPNPLYTPHFSQIIKGNTGLINSSVGPNRQLSYISKANQIPMLKGVGEMYYVKGYFVNEQGHKSKCKFYLYNSKDSQAQVLEPHCS